MKTVKIQEKELNEARELQKKCVDLHLPVPPIVLWDATIIDKNGIEKERTIAKANSYVRNALNILSRYVGMSSVSISNGQYFKDGLLSLKNSNGEISSAVITLSNNVNDFHIMLGDKTSPTPETLDHFEMPTLTANSWNWAGNLHYSDFNETTRKLITQFIAVLVNTSNQPRYISEAVVYLNTYSSQFIMLRDVFTPIAVGAGESIRFVYQTEVLFPQ